MRRADRLFQIVQYLRARRLTTAADLARWLGVSPRTVYRDIRDLSLSGVPILGEAGTGYRLGPRFDLPPIMFTIDEVQALVAGARMIDAWGGAELAAHARSAIAKVTLVLPEARRGEIGRTRLFAVDFHVPEQAAAGLDRIRQAILDRRKLLIDYVDGSGNASRRTVRPLAAFYWGTAWSLAAWCEHRNDFRNFRLDRIQTLQLSVERFEETPGRTLADFLARPDR